MKKVWESKPEIIEENGEKKIQLTLIEKEVSDEEFLKHIPWFLDMRGDMDLIRNNLFPILKREHYVIPQCSYMNYVNGLMLDCLNNKGDIKSLFKNFYEQVYIASDYFNLKQLYKELINHPIIKNESVKPFEICIKAIELLNDDATYVVIPTLLVILENIWDDLFPTPDRAIKKAEIKNHCKTDTDCLNAEILNDVIFEYTKHGSATNPYLNRNKILHGECKDYANATTMYILITQIEFLSGLLT